MSRSRKKTPYSGDRKSKFMKTYANRKLRRKSLEHNFQNKSYKKDFQSYNICDYYHIETKNFDKFYENYVRRWYERNLYYGHLTEGKDPPSKKEIYKEYIHWYIRK